MHSGKALDSSRSSLEQPRCYDNARRNASNCTGDKAVQLEGHEYTLPSLVRFSW